jgi:hypothetical protein
MVAVGPELDLYCDISQLNASASSVVPSAPLTATVDAVQASAVDVATTVE